MTSFMERVLPMDRAEELAQRIELPDSVMQAIASTAWTVFGPACDAFESAVKQQFPDLYERTATFLQPHAHAFSDRLPYLNPWHVVFSVLAYFALIITFGIVGKILGKRSYKLFGILHNLFLHVLSVYMFAGLLFSARAAGYTLWNNASGNSDKDYRVAKFVWLFYVSKVPEWIDTVLMLLKHNYHQVSFLHVYHHLSIYVIWWLASYKAPGGEAYYSAMVNSGVHVFMYGYYFLTMIFPTGPIRRFLNNFKFVITKGQMTQFFFNCLQSVYDLALVPADQLKYSRGLLWLLFGYMISLLLLFGNFLMQSKKRPRDVYSPFASPVSSPVSNGGGRRSFKETQNRPTNGKANGNASSGNGNNNNGNNNNNNGNGNGSQKPGMTKAQLREAEKHQRNNNKKKS